MKELKDKTLLITGGTGSFGSSVLKSLISQSAKEIRIFSRDEKKQEDLRKKYNNNKIKFIIGDVRDLNGLEDAIKGVDFIFHAAALKQVPSCEFYPLEAVKTNILGTDNIVSCAIKHDVEKVVFLSTDKAVYPINAMGISKAMAEKVVIARSSFVNSSTILSCTRYGNVMGSRGSVIPLFIKQIISNQELTITDPKMTRFLMSLDESVNLVKYAFTNSTQGDIFVQKSPAATIQNIALAVMEIFESKSKIRYIGTRHGEKLFESLISREEMSRAVELDNFYRIPADNRNLNYDLYFDHGSKEIDQFKDYTSHNTDLLTVNEIKTLLENQDFINNRDYLND